MLPRTLTLTEAQRAERDRTCRRDHRPDLREIVEARRQRMVLL